MATTKTPPTAAPADKLGRDQSTIAFPYGDQDDAVAVAQAIMKLGGVPCEPDQLAAALGQVPTGGNFRMKVATAKLFGVIETVQGRYKLTDLGYEIVDAARSKNARVESFLRVPLYRKIYDEFRNRQLPPRPAALEHAIVTFGVAQKQKERARQVFDRSAQQAGFFDQGGRDRLVRPAGTASSLGEAIDTSEAKAAESDREIGSGGGSSNGGGRGGGGGGGHHPFIEGLLQTLPEPGTLWTVEGRAAWLQAAAQNFTLIYKGDGKIDVQVHLPAKADK